MKVKELKEILNSRDDLDGNQIRIDIADEIGGSVGCISKVYIENNKVIICSQTENAIYSVKDFKNLLNERNDLDECETELLICGNPNERGEVKIVFAYWSYRARNYIVAISNYPDGDKSFNYLDGNGE